VPGNSHLKRTFAIATAMVLAASNAALYADVQATSRVHYLGNGGVMVEHGQTKILFDPLFRGDYGMFELLPPELERALIAATPPWDGVDAVFISHNHDDHFDPALMLSYIQTHPNIELYAPTQAVEGLRLLAVPPDDGVFDRVHSLALEYGDVPVRTEMNGLLIEAVRIPHAGWPVRNPDIENIAFRITLDDVTTVTHLGDADTDAAHFDASHWDQRRTHLALSPYWFFNTPEGRDILLTRIHADHSVGVHVPKKIPDEPSERPIEFQGADLFTRPGETRDIPAPDLRPE
jgi:L-ascorbate metabolism protein UlaG (beta-lactamase superfamily)